LVPTRTGTNIVRAVDIFEAFLWSKGPSQHNDLRLSKPKRKRDALRVWTFHQFQRNDGCPTLLEALS
jgi:hypothetical protein